MGNSHVVVGVEDVELTEVCIGFDQVPRELLDSCVDARKVPSIILVPTSDYQVQYLEGRPYSNLSGDVVVFTHALLCRRCGVAMSQL